MSFKRQVLEAAGPISQSLHRLDAGEAEMVIVNFQGRAVIVVSDRLAELLTACPVCTTSQVRVAARGGAQ